MRDWLKHGVRSARGLCCALVYVYYAVEINTAGQESGLWFIS
jgi:hypothetical protein